MTPPDDFASPRPGKDPADPVRGALAATGESVIQLLRQHEAATIRADLESVLQGLMGHTPPAPDPDPCSGGANASPCAQREREFEAAAFTYDGCVEDAQTTFQSAKRTWARALATYDFSLSQADASLRQAVQAGKRLRPSRQDAYGQAEVYSVMKRTVARDLQAFQESAASAGGVLAAAAGELVAAGRAYLSALQGAAAERAAGDAAALETFWTNAAPVGSPVAGRRDSSGAARASPPPAPAPRSPPAGSPARAARGSAATRPDRDSRSSPRR